MTCSSCENEIQQIIETKEDGFKRLKYTCPCGWARPKTEEAKDVTSSVTGELVFDMWEGYWGLD